MKKMKMNNKNKKFQNDFQSELYNINNIKYFIKFFLNFFK